MKHKITVSLEFSFKGKRHSPSVVVDLGAHVISRSNFDSLYPLLANKNNIDVYSYEYEMMLTEELIFSEATGLAENFLVNGKFDFSAFEQALHDESLTEVLSKIASEHLSVDDLSSEPKLKAALLAAYKLDRP
jgi:hypothetical protein